MASDFGITNGLMQTRLFVVDTEDADRSKVDGRSTWPRKTGPDIHPEQQGFRLFSLRSPLYVKGTFKNRMSASTRECALKAGAAVALGAMATPLAALLALIKPGPEQENPCPGLMAEARENRWRRWRTNEPAKTSCSLSTGCSRFPD